MQTMPKDPAKLWKIGFGTVNGKNLLDINTSLMGSVLLANSPQVLLSYLYLAFNALYTNMFIAQEWGKYYYHRKSLRVTAPIGQQRDTYWLSVPFRYAIPMTVLSGLFHWLASQSLFLVQITVTANDPQNKSRYVSPKDSISTCGFSPLAIILTTVTGTVIAIGGLAIGRIKLPPGMPVAGSNSAAISASCHPPDADVEAHLKPVMWGAVNHQVEHNGNFVQVGHCTFSSWEVEPLTPGLRYL